MEKTLTISGAQARKIYPTADNALRSILETNFGKEYFSQKITDRIKTLDDAYEAIGETRPTDSDLQNLGLTPDEICYRHLKVLAKALNEGWEPNMYNTNQNKYYPYFSVGSSSFAFLGTYYDYSYAFAGGASRLCFDTEAKAEYAGRQFIDLWNIILLK